MPICDGHDSAILTINTELVRHGTEVVYLGYHRAASAIVRAAIQEDVAAIGLSSYNGGHIEFFSEVVDRLRKAGAGDIGVFGGGGGTITPADARIMQRRGVDRIFFAGTPLEEICECVLKRYGRPGATPHSIDDRLLARAISQAEAAPAANPKSKIRNPECRMVGVAGAGGAGKSTLIDELVFRFLRRRPRARVAVLCNDPSHAGSGGALLGDRASMIYAQDDRVFMRSLATRGSPGGLARAASAAAEILRASGRFELILVESIGIGQDSDPFHDLRGRRWVDATVLVMTPHYGGRLQLQKIGLLDRAECVALNKADVPGAETARAELAARLEANGRGQRLVATVASRHADRGVDELFETLRGAGTEVVSGCG